MAILDEQEFEKLFTDWFGGLHVYACALLKDDAGAEEVVQSVFYRLWEKRETLPEIASPKAYLYGSVYHACIDRLRLGKMARARQREIGHPGDSSGATDHPATAMDGDAAEKLELRELEARYQQVVEQLPEQCRNIFQLSRFGGLRYREIAGQLGLSVKTVEAQMSKALKRLREELADYL